MGYKSLLLFLFTSNRLIKFGKNRKVVSYSSCYDFLNRNKRRQCDIVLRSEEYSTASKKKIKTK